MVKFRCLDCGYCCTLKVKLSLIEFLKIYIHGFRNFYSKNSRKELVIKSRKNGDCHFLDRSKNSKTKCLIYNLRPKMCREYPGI